MVRAVILPSLGRAALLLLLFGGAAVRADDFEEPGAISAEAVFKRCPSGQGIATANCLGGQVTKLRGLLKARIAAQLTAIAKVATQTARPGLLGGPDAAAAWKRDLLAAQAAWESYDARQCGNVFDYDWYGGSGAGSAKLACEIRHLVVRVNELATP